MKRTFSTRLILLTTALLIVAGCNGKKTPDGLPKLYPCEITVIQDGKPLAGATVILFSEDNSVTWGVSGGTLENGVAVMYTHGDFKGAPAGKYKVVITKTVIENQPTQEQLQNPNFAGSFGDSYDTVALKYKNMEKTPLRIEVKTQKTIENFDIGTAVKNKIKNI
jgi:hypothetical protein